MFRDAVGQPFSSWKHRGQNLVLDGDERIYVWFEVVSAFAAGALIECRQIHHGSHSAAWRQDGKSALADEQSVGEVVHPIESVYHRDR